MDPSKMRICYCITENKGRSFFTRIGVGFVNKDGSINIKLNCFPVSGEFQLRNYEPKTESEKKGHIDDDEIYPRDDFPF